MQKRIRRFSALMLALLLALVLLLSCGQGGPSTAIAPSGGEAAGGRYAEVFDTAEDAGRFTARFIQQLSVADEKTGDAAILTFPGGETMLVDAGMAESAPQIIAALEAMGLTRLDYVMATHPHYDHIGGMAAVLARFEVGEILATELYHNTETYQGYLAAIEQHGTPVRVLREGDTLAIGGVEMKVFNPEPAITYYDGYPDKGTAFMNDRSLVVKFIYGEVSMLFTADIYRARESELVEKYGDELRATLLKIPHHGNDTSSSIGFIEAVAPEAAVMTYNTLASMSVAKSYTKRGVALYATFLYGSVKASTDGKTLTLLSQYTPEGEPFA